MGTTLVTCHLSCFVVLCAQRWHGGTKVCFVRGQASGEIEMARFSEPDATSPRRTALKLKHAQKSNVVLKALSAQKTTTDFP